MQYILSEEEYNELLRRATARKIELDKKYQNLCTKIADELPIDAGWRSVEPAPWGCILTKKREWYCDRCPVKEICPYPNKHYSK